ncbi:hypothetical protein DsansV1_C32g0221131 [Dioscorea sansibarensis]
MNMCGFYPPNLPKKKKKIETISILEFLLKREIEAYEEKKGRTQQGKGRREEKISRVRARQSKNETTGDFTRTLEVSAKKLYLRTSACVAPLPCSQTSTSVANTNQFNLHQDYQVSFDI